MLQKWKAHQEELRRQATDDNGASFDDASPTASDLTQDGFVQDSRASAASSEDNRMLTDDDMRRRQARKDATDEIIKPRFSDLAIRRQRRPPTSPDTTPSSQPQQLSTQEDSDEFLTDYSPSDDSSPTARSSSWSRLRSPAMLSTEPPPPPTSRQTSLRSEDAENARLQSSDLRLDAAQRSRDARAEGGDRGTAWSRLRENEKEGQSGWDRVRARGNERGRSEGAVGGGEDEGREAAAGTGTGTGGRSEAQRQFDEMLEKERAGGEDAEQETGRSQRGGGWLR